MTIVVHQAIYRISVVTSKILYLETVLIKQPGLGSHYINVSKQQAHGIFQTLSLQRA